MRIGIGLGTSGAPPTLDGLIESARQAETAGFDSVWLSNIFGLDALTTLALIRDSHQQSLALIDLADKYRESKLEAGEREQAILEAMIVKLE